MAQTKVSLIKDSVIVVGHLHTNHGITTGHIGEGANLYFTDARVMTSLGSVSTHIIPDTDIAYDLGSTTNRFRDLYLSGNTIHLGGDTKISVNNDGEVEFKDSSDAPKRLKVRELDFVDDQGRNKRFKIDATSGRLATFDAVGTLTADKLDLSAMSTTDLAEGNNLYYTDSRVGTYLTTNNYATQSYVQSQVSGLVASAPSTLDTLNELAAALGDDPNFATTISNQIGGKLSSSDSRIANWDTAYGWGDHAAVGYLTSFTETDPTVPSHVKSISTTNISNWNTAHGWGNHANAGYLTSYSETSTLDSVADRGRSTNQQLISTNPSGFRVDSGSHARIELDSNSNWSYIRLQNNGTTTWDIASYQGGNLEWRPGGGETNRMTLSQSGYLTVNGSMKVVGGVIDMNNNDGFVYDDGSNIMYVKLDGTNREIIHSANIGSQSVNYANSAGAVAWGNVSGKPSTFAPSSHNHDDRYYTESESNSRFTSKDHFRSTGTGYYSSTTTSALLTEALGDGAFDSYLTAHKTGWSYAGNGNLTDAGRLTELAGSSWLWWTDNPADGVQGNVTGLCIAPNTGGSAGKVFIYNNQGSGYAPGWREVWTSRSHGSGSGLDADLLDGQHASAFQPAGSYAPAGGSAGTDWYCDDLFYDQWIRNNGTGDSGLYWHNSSHDGYAWHIYPQTRADMTFRTGSGNGGIKGTVGDATARGYVHWTTSNEIGFLNASRSWSLRVDNSGNTFATGSHRAPIFYDSDNTGYYVNPASTSNFNAITSQGESNFRTKKHLFGLSNNWDAVGFDRQTNVHFQGHNQFWIGAGNGTWFTGTANNKSATSGLSADASNAHDLLITTMQSTSTYDRGITFAVDNTGSGNSGWRLGKWHSGDAYDSSKLTVDGGLFVKGGYTDEFEYYADDYSAYYSSQGGTSYWTGGTNNPSITASTAIQIQSGTSSANSRNPQLQFHQHGYGGVQFRYDGPNDRMYLEPMGTNRFDWYRNKTDHGYIDFGPANSGHAHIYTDRANFYFNKQLTVSGGSQVNSGDIRAGVIYDINDTNVRLDSTRLVLRGTDPTVIFRDTDHTSAMWHVNSHKMYLLRGNGDTEGWTQISGQWPVYWDLGNNNAYFGGTVVATNAFTAPIFYDSNNTSYYVNPASTSVMQKVLSYDGYKCNTEKGMVGNYDAAGTADKIIWTIGDAWNSLGSHYGIGYDYDGTYGHHLVFRNNGSAYSRIPFSSQAALLWGGVKAPVFYDSNDTAYYCNPATQSNLKAVTLSGTTNTGYINCYHSGTYGSAMNMEFTGSQSNGLYIKNNRGSTGDSITFAYSNAPQPPRGTISVSSTGVSYNSVSDYRAKENVTPLTGAIDRVSLLKPSRFNFIGDGETVDGFLAHEVQEVVPQAVNGEKDAVDNEGNDLYQSMDASKMVPLLTAALQEAIAKIEDLESRLQAIENQ